MTPLVRGGGVTRSAARSAVCLSGLSGGGGTEGGWTGQSKPLGVDRFALNTQRPPLRRFPPTGPKMKLWSAPGFRGRGGGGLQLSDTRRDRRRPARRSTLRRAAPGRRRRRVFSSRPADERRPAPLASGGAVRVHRDPAAAPTSSSSTRSAVRSRGQ